MLSASNECPPPLLTMIKEGEQDDDGHLNNNNRKKMMLASKEGGERVMEKAPLKCPRCDSTNTKFCYYNNYSLSQPRHFCKACKRYWTRGGTLRTVPVGGGCRKNKRVIKRVINPNLSSPPNPASITPNSSSPTACNNNNTSTTSHESLNPSLLYGLPTNLINGFPFSYDNNYHHLGGVSNGLEFGYSTTCTTTPKQILHDLISNSNPFHGSNPSSSTLHQHQHHQQQQQQQKFSFETLFPYDLDLQIKGVGSHVSEGGGFKDIDSVKLECQVQNGYHQIHQQPTGESDPSILWSANSNGNTSVGVNWLDPNYSNQIGSSSVPSLI